MKLFFRKYGLLTISLLVLVFVAACSVANFTSQLNHTVSYSLRAESASRTYGEGEGWYWGGVARVDPVKVRYGVGYKLVVNRSNSLTTITNNYPNSGYTVTPSALSWVPFGWAASGTATTITITYSTVTITTTIGSGTHSIVTSSNHTSTTGGAGIKLNAPPTSGDFYGGDEFYYTTKQSYGLLATAEVKSPVIQLNTPLGRGCFQLGFNTSKGVGMLLNAYGGQGYGIVINGTSLKVVKGEWNTSSNTLTVTGVLKEVSIADVPNPLVYVKLDVNGDGVVAMVNVADASNAGTSYWYKVVFTQSNTYVSNLVIEGTDHVVGSMLIMNGDYIKVSGDQSFMVSINGTDLLGRHVYVNVTDGSAGDCDSNANEIMYCNPFWLWPLKGTLSVNIPSVPLQYNLSLTGTFTEYAIGMGANYSMNINTTGLANLNLPFITDFADYRDLIAVFIILLIVLLAAEANAPAAGFIAVGAMIFFAVIGWLHVGGAAIGTAIVIVGLGATISRKGNS